MSLVSPIFIPLQEITWSFMEIEYNSQLPQLLFNKYTKLDADERNAERTRLLCLFHTLNNFIYNGYLTNKIRDPILCMTPKYIVRNSFSQSPWAFDIESEYTSTPLLSSHYYDTIADLLDSLQLSIVQVSRIRAKVREAFAVLSRIRHAVVNYAVV